MAQGRIKALNAERGYGFVAADGESADLYFQRDAVAGEAFAALREGQRVEFTVVPDPLMAGRLRAEQLRPVG
jgi:CspA family cold shock protein